MHRKTLDNDKKPREGCIDIGRSFKTKSLKSSHHCTVKPPRNGLVRTPQLRAEADGSGEAGDLPSISGDDVGGDAVESL